jgi:hypothetical protein
VLHPEGGAQAGERERREVILGDIADAPPHHPRDERGVQLVARGLEHILAGLDGDVRLHLPERVGAAGAGRAQLKELREEGGEDEAVL